MSNYKKENVQTIEGGFLTGIFRELKAVSWPSSKSLMINVLIVLAVILVTTGFVWGLDTVFAKIISLIV